MFDGEIKITGKHASYVKFLAAKTTQLNKGVPCVGAFKRYKRGIYINPPYKLKDRD